MIILEDIPNMDEEKKQILLSKITKELKKKSIEQFGSINLFYIHLRQFIRFISPIFNIDLTEYLFVLYKSQLESEVKIFYDKKDFEQYIDKQNKKEQIELDKSKTILHNVNDENDDILNKRRVASEDTRLKPKKRKRRKKSNSEPTSISEEN